MTVSSPPFGLRVAAARELLEQRELAAARGWQRDEWRTRTRRLASAHAGGSDVDSMVEGLTLVAREWLAASGCSPEAELVTYGERIFSPLLAPGPCQSHRLWGYVCPFAEEGPSYDHLFPATLGGPTEASNLLVLCRKHNLMKSMDI